MKESGLSRWIWTCVAATLGVWLTPLALAAGGPEVVLDLVERFPVAHICVPVRQLLFDRPSDFHYLSAGWYPLERDEKKQGFAWTRGRNAVLELPVVRPVDLRVELSVNALPDPAGRLPQQRLRLLWNDHDLGSFALSATRQALEFDVPAELQHRGLNRLHLLPLYWVEPDGPLRGPRRRPLGVQVWHIRLEPARVEVSGPGAPARTTGRSLFQAAGTSISYAFELPPGARLRARGRLHLASGALPNQPEGEVVVALQSDGSEERVLQRRGVRELAGTTDFVVDEDLSELGGRMARVTFAFSLAEWRDASSLQRLPAPEGVEFEWINPVIQGRVEREPPRRSEAERRRYNVLLVLLDTLRSDHTEPYGGKTVQTPALRRLAAAGVTFENAFTNSSWTRPAVASLLTSMRPTAHRTLHLKDKLANAVPYLPEILRAAGYRTVAISNNGHFSRALGFARGFDQFHEYFRTRNDVLQRLRSPEAQAASVWRTFIAPEARNAEQKPFFVFLHEIDPHAPYAPLPPYDELYDFGYRGNIMGYEMEKYHENIKILRAANHYRGWLDEPDLRYLQSRYDAEITFMDRYLGWILERLEESGLAEDTLVIFLSDHGEGFMEHGSLGHGQHVYEEVLRVPLIFSLPDVVPAGRRPTVHAQLLDVGPTILDLLGIEAPEMLQGMSLLPHLDGSEKEGALRPIIARSNSSSLPKGTPLRLVQAKDSLRYGGWKLIRHDYDFRTTGQYQYELYDLVADPGEKLNLWPGKPVMGAVFRQELEWQHHLDLGFRLEAEQEVQLEPEIEENLKALGYLE
jgi:arylsulfatase A-like enzyme